MVSIKRVSLFGSIFLTLIIVVYNAYAYMHIYASPPLNQRHRKVIFVFSNQRSGSTFLGEFFNKNPSIFYLYEPLFPYDFYCEQNIERRIRTLERLSVCDFGEVSKVYQLSNQVKGMVADDRARCRRDNICYAYKSDTITNMYPRLCVKLHKGEQNLKLGDLDTLENPSSSTEVVPHSCSNPDATYNSTLVSGLCAASSAVVYKILRVSDLSMLEELYDELHKKNYDVRVVQLVRDPRAILRSHYVSENVSPNDLKVYTDKVCQRMKRNIQYLESRDTGDNGVRFYCLLGIG